MKSLWKDRKPLFRYLRKGVFSTAAMLIFLQASPALAQTITTVTPLDFGIIALRDYAVVGRVTILPGGGFTYNANVYLHQNPVRGEYMLQGFDPNSIYSVMLPPAVVLTGPGGPFTLDSFVVEPALLITDGAGDDTFYIIGRLLSAGGGILYPDGTYDTTFLVTVVF
jgi:hypothetical protein